MAIEVGEGFGVIGDHGIEVECLRIGEVGVRHGYRDVGPVGGEPAAEAVGVGAGAEIVVAGLGVAFFAFEFVICGAGVGVRPLAAVGVEVGVVTNDAGIRSDDAGRAERIFSIELRGAARGEQGDAFAAEENVFVSCAAGSVCFRQNFAAGARVARDDNAVVVASRARYIVPLHEEWRKDAAF